MEKHHRRCISCRKVAPKADFWRVVRVFTTIPAPVDPQPQIPPQVHHGPTGTAIAESIGDQTGVDQQTGVGQTGVDQPNHPKAALTRVVLDQGMGRSAYICPCADCLKNAQKKDRLSRALKAPVDPQVYAQLQQRLDALLMQQRNQG